MNFSLPCRSKKVKANQNGQFKKSNAFKNRSLIFRTFVNKGDPSSRSPTTSLTFAHPGKKMLTVTNSSEGSQIKSPIPISRSSERLL